MKAATNERMPWEQFRKFRGSLENEPDNFYGCLMPEDGGVFVWFDSSLSFDIAVHWCCYACGEFELTPEQEIEWMNTEGRKHGISIVHGETIKRMYEFGLIV